MVKRRTECKKQLKEIHVQPNYDFEASRTAFVLKVVGDLILFYTRILPVLFAITGLMGCSPTEYTVAVYRCDDEGLRIIVSDVNECDVRRCICGFLETPQIKHGPFHVINLECGRSFDKSEFELVSNDDYIVFRRVDSLRPRLVYDRVSEITLDPDQLPDGVKRLLEQRTMSKPDLDK